MQWTEPGLIIGVRRHGESSVILEAMTAGHGRHLGLVRGGRSRRNRAILQAGNSVLLQWHARLEEHLGTFQVELETARAARMIAAKPRLYLSQVLFSHLRLLPERDPHPRLLTYALEIIDSPASMDERLQMLALFEMTLLDELGFGLDLAACALTGESEGLSHVSPRTGRAVTRKAAGKYVDRLLELPAFFRRPGTATPAQVAAGLKLTGHFLDRHIWSLRANSAPPERERLLGELGRNAS